MHSFKTQLWYWWGREGYSKSYVYCSLRDHSSLQEKYATTKFITNIVYLNHILGVINFNMWSICYFYIHANGNVVCTVPMSERVRHKYIKENQRGKKLFSKSSVQSVVSNNPNCEHYCDIFLYFLVFPMKINKIC